MRRLVPYVNRTYFQKLLAGLLLFIFLLYLPFSILTLRISKQTILNNINVSNQTVLEQLKQNYNNFSDNIRGLASSIFWRNDIQKILYNSSVTHEEVYFTLQELYATFIVSHPGLQSICIYNKYNQELYTVTSAGTINKADFLDFVREQEAIRPLQPLLHEFSVRSYMSTLQPMVFSYFMYQFNDPSQTNESYLVLNQFASQSVSSINTVTAGNQSIPTATYYVSDTASTTSPEPLPEMKADYEVLLENFRHRQKDDSLDGNFYTDRIDDRQYLISYITVSNSDSLVIIQDYDLVFEDLNTLSRNLLILSSVFLVVAIGLALLISRRLYQPIDNVLDYFSRQDTPSVPERTGRNLNELDVIKTIYDAANEQSRRLEGHANRYQPIAQQYNLASLMLKSDERGVEQFRRVQPSHWLLTSAEFPLTVLLLRPEYQQSVQKTPEDSEISLLLYSAQNIVEELLEPGYHRSCFKHAGNTLGIVIRPRKSDPAQTPSQILEQTCQVMTEHFNIRFAASISGSSCQLTALSNLYSQAVTGLSYAFLFGPVVIPCQQIAANEQNSQTDYPEELDIRLEEAIVAQDLEQCRRVLAEIQSALRMLNIGNATIATISLLNQVHRLLCKHCQCPLPSMDSAVFQTVYNHISGTGSIDQCFDAILSHIAAQMSGEGAEAESSDQLFVSTILDFVQNSYFDYNLSSQLIADYLDLNNRYMMKKFKALTGKTLTDYIVTFRLKKAAALLRNTSAPISTVAEQVGMDNLSYFYRLFKKVYGCTPKEYRSTDIPGNNE